MRLYVCAFLLVFIGFALGVIFMAACACGGRADDAIERMLAQRGNGRGEDETKGMVEVVDDCTIKEVKDGKR